MFVKGFIQALIIIIGILIIVADPPSFAHSIVKIILVIGIIALGLILIWTFPKTFTGDDDLNSEANRMLRGAVVLAIILIAIISKMIKSS